MKFKLDENLPFSLMKIIQSSNDHHVESVLYEGLSGSDDRKLIEHCYKEERVLITLDNDFIHSIIPKKQNIYGIIILKTPLQGKNAVNTLFRSFIGNYNLLDSKGKIVIVETNQIKERTIL